MDHNLIVLAVIGVAAVVIFCGLWANRDTTVVLPPAEPAEPPRSDLAAFPEAEPVEAAVEAPAEPQGVDLVLPDIPTTVSLPVTETKPAPGIGVASSGKAFIVREPGGSVAGMIGGGGGGGKAKKPAAKKAKAKNDKKPRQRKG